MKRTAASLLALCLGIAVAHSAGWPQYRADACRSGYTPEPLPMKLSLKWIRHARHAPRRAWVGRSMAPSRMKFDWAYSVVVAKGVCYFGSSADDKIYAIDASTGEEKWIFFTGGPARLAPAVWEDRVYAVSDDGFLYCLSASDGSLLWKLRGGPSADLQIGNSRMVSRWVARGGPAIRDGIVYFGASIWPIEGTYIYAVDAKRGKVIWCNDNTGALEIDHPHQIAYSRGGVMAQGYFAVNRNKVFVPVGRSVPAAFDRETGRYLYFHLSRYGGKTTWGGGGGDVVATDDVFFNSGLVFDCETGLRFDRVGNRKKAWWKPFVWKGERGSGHSPGDRQVIVCTPDGFVRAEGKAICGATRGKRTFEEGRENDTSLATPHLTHLKQIKLEKYQSSARANIELIDDAPTLKGLWKIEIDDEPKSLIVAGKTIAFGSNNKISVINSDSKKVTWSAEVDGAVYALAAAAGRLYASTGTGAIYCFSGEETGAPKEIRPQPKTSPYPEDSIAAKAAKEIIERAGITKGYCVDLSCGDGALAYELAKRTDLTVIAVDSDPANVADARRKLDAAGLYGIRVAVVQGDAKGAHLPDYFANLIVSSASLREGADSVASTEVRRIQRPLTGTLCVGKPGEMKIKVREGLAGAGSWTHPYADPGNTMNSGDTVVKGPLGLLWYEDETQVTIDRHMKGPSPLVYKGMVIREGVHSVRAIDAYNGTVLWQAEMPDVLAQYRFGTWMGASQVGPTYCVADDVVYVRQDSHCVLRNVFSGKELGRFEAPRRPDGKKGKWTYIACKDGALYGSLANESHLATRPQGKTRSFARIKENFTESSLFFAMDAKTGKVKWVYPAKESIRTIAIAVGDGLVYLIDRAVAEMDKIDATVALKIRRGGKPLPPHPTGTLLALDAETGAVKWGDSDNIFGTLLVVSTQHNALLMTYNGVSRGLNSDGGLADRAKSKGMRCYNASDGTRMWERKESAMRPVIYDRTIYGFPKAWDLLTGEPRVATHPKPGQDRNELWMIRGKAMGCGTQAGSAHLLLQRSATIGYYDLAYDNGWMENYGGIRGAGCWANALPAAGLVVVPDDTRSCRCSYQNQATIALMQAGVRPPEIEPTMGGNYRNVRFTREGVFTGSLTITMSHQNEDMDIRYTLDRTYPTMESPLYTEPITLTETTYITAAAFKEGKKRAVRGPIFFKKVSALKRRGKRKKKQ